MAKTTNSGYFNGGVKYLTPIDGSVGHGHTLRLSPHAAKELEEALQASESHPKALNLPAPSQDEGPKAQAVRKPYKASKAN